MFIISNPQDVKYIEGKDNFGTLEILGCYPNYGSTIGNAVRRVLLSSIEGAAITSIKIKGVSHEFSTINGVLEDVVQIILNLKQVRFTMNVDEPVSVSLKFKGEGEVTASSIKTNSSVEVINKDQYIATLTDKKSDLEIDILVEKGIGYVSVEQRENRVKDLGVIAIDAVYTPVKRVNYRVENMRVGKRTDYEKIIFEIGTDGSLTPKDAFYKAINILIDQFNSLASGKDVE
jgi:DNA-directed RNA polymerase subunit alpha